MNATKRANTGSAPAITPQALWSGALVVMSLLAALLRQQHPAVSATVSPLAYIPPMMAALSLAIVCWVRFKREPSGWWLGIASAFFLFFILSGQQFLIEAFEMNKGTPLPWQPWVIARLFLALGILSASASPQGLLPQAGRSRREAGWTLAMLAAIACPVWTRYLPGSFYWPAANGMSVIDTFALIVGGIAIVAAYVRIRKRADSEPDAFLTIIHAWLLALGWGAACRALPLDTPTSAAWMEMLVVGIASLGLCAQLVWSVAESQTRSESALVSLEASREVLKCISSVPDSSVAAIFLRAASSSLGAQKASLVLMDPSDTNMLVVVGEYPTGATASQVGTRLSIEPSRRTGFWSGPTARAITKGRTIAVDGVRSDVEFVPWRDAATSQSYQISVPVVEGEKVVGAALYWFSQGSWRPSICVPIAEAIVDSASPVLARIGETMTSGTDSASAA